MSKKTIDAETVLSFSKADQIEELSRALLREYMHKKKYFETLRIFDEECPRTTNTINSRAVMASLMYLEPLQSRTTVQGANTIMEILCEDRAKKREASKDLPGLREKEKDVTKKLNALQEKTAKKKKQKKSEGKGLTIEELLEKDDFAGRPTSPQEPVVQPRPSAVAAAEELLKVNLAMDTKQKSSSLGARPVHSEDEDNTNGDEEEEDERKGHDVDASPPRPQTRMGWSTAATEDTLPPKGYSSGTTHIKNMSDEEDEEPTAPKKTSTPAVSINPLSKPLKLFICGLVPFIPKSFMQQGFCFCDDVPYGLIQFNGGPCGVISAVQGVVLKRWFMSGVGPGDVRRLRREWLLQALIDILFAINARRIIIVHKYGDPGRPLDTFDTTTCESRKDAEDILGDVLDSLYMTEKGLGILSFILSCVLTRGGIDATKSDMDHGNQTTLIVEHGYCSQELVNLILTGKATSNVFDGNKNMDGLILKGIAKKCDVGLLSMMEYHNQLEVGTYLKNPVHPIWVIYNESHYSILFHKPKGADDDLWYFDPLGGQTEEIRLTLKDIPKGKNKRPQGDLTPYLEDILRTRSVWSEKMVDWNGTDPLL